MRNTVKTRNVKKKSTFYNSVQRLFDIDERANFFLKVQLNKIGPSGNRKIKYTIYQK